MILRRTADAVENRVRLQNGFDALEKCTVLNSVRLNGRSRRHLFLKEPKVILLPMLTPARSHLEYFFLEYHASENDVHKWV